MLDIFYFACNAVLPIVLCVLLGYFLRRIKFFDEPFLNKANSLCFKVLLPTLLFFNIAFIDKSSFENMNWMMVVYSALAIIALFIIGTIMVMVLVKNPKQKGVILQCFFRSNYALIGIPLCEFLAPEAIKAECLGLASIVSAITIPLFNAFAVIALTVFDKEAGNKIDVKKIGKKIITNPLILGVCAGLVVLGIRMLLINAGVDASKANLEGNFLYKTISNISKCASPLALIVLGGKFQFSAVKKLLPQILLGTLSREIFVPIVCLLIAYALGFREIEFPALIALFCTPVAVSSAPMAAEMKQDEELAGQLVVWTSIVSIFTLFIAVMICCQVGIFTV